MDVGFDGPSAFLATLLILNFVFLPCAYSSVVAIWKINSLSLSLSLSVSLSLALSLSQTAMSSRQRSDAATGNVHRPTAVSRNGGTSS